MSSSQNKPKIVCLTGGMGSGKSTVAQMFADLGISVYNADNSAKRLMHQDGALKEILTELLGSNTYDEQGQLNRSWIAQKLFSDPELLHQWNAAIHPRVSDDFDQWFRNQRGNYVIKEAAILFETGGQKKCSLSILITAPAQVRIRRVMQRDSWTKDQVLARLKHQWSDERKMPMADFVLENLDLRELTQEVNRLHDILSQQEN